MTSTQLPASIPSVFLVRAAGILGDTDNGASGQDIVTITAAYASDTDTEIPHPTTPLTVNKRTALAQNIAALPARAQYQALLDLCGRVQFRLADETKNLRMSIISRYGHLSGGEPEWALSHGLVSGTQEWLVAYPQTLTLYNQALAKYEAKLFKRNCLDDLRLALELLIQSVLSNDKSLENQIAPLGKFVKTSGGSIEFSNMFQKLVDYYCKYQNTYVKHDDAVIEAEVEFIFELTSSFAKQLVRLAAA